MSKLSILIAAAATLAVPAMAAEDPIAVRKALMSANGAAAGVAVGVMKDEITYAPIIGLATIRASAAAADAFGDFLPEGTADDPRTIASPKIWEDPEGFQAALVEFQQATASAVEAAGKDGPADAAAFIAAMQPVLKTCENCHENYRVKRE